MGKKRDYDRRKEAKFEKLQSIRMMPRDWLKQLDIQKEFKEEFKQ